MVSGTRIGGKNAVAFVKDKEPVLDEETGTFICGEVIGPNLLCTGTPIAPRWRCNRHGGRWKPTEKQLATKPGESIYTTKGLWKGYQSIHKTLTANPELIEQLYSGRLTEEVAVSRILLAELLQTEDGQELDTKRRETAMKALRLIGKIAQQAKDIQLAESHELKKEFMDGIIAAVVHAFTRCNAYSRPSERARIFMQEFASLLPGNIPINIPVDDTVEGELVPTN
jgi:hypothetical protein